MYLLKLRSKHFTQTFLKSYWHILWDTIKKIITCKLLRFLFNSSSFLYDFCYATRNYHALSKTSNLWVCSSALISRQLSNWIKKQKCIQKIYKIYPNWNQPLMLQHAEKYCMVIPGTEIYYDFPIQPTPFPRNMYIQQWTTVKIELNNFM